MNLEKYLYDKIVPLILSWNADNIYAISFFVYANETSVYEGLCNFPEVSVGYNTEEDCKGSSLFDEERWNFAFWSQNNECIIDSVEAKDGAAFLFNWYRSKGINNIGSENDGTQYDENMNYIGKGPGGYYELLCAVSNVARRIQKEGIIAERFGRIPVIVHDLDYAWYVEEATRNANPNKEAEVFLDYLSKNKKRSEFADIENAYDENAYEKETLLSSAHNAQINSLDDAINTVDKLLPFLGEESHSGVDNILEDFFTHLGEIKEDISDDAD